MKSTRPRFWILLFTLNFLVFLPGFVVNSGSDSFFPIKGFLDGSFYERSKFFFVRDNHDIFRISIDLFFLVSVYFIFKNHIRPLWFGLITGIYYALILCFLTYYQIFDKLYFIPPMLYDDLPLIKLGYNNSNFSSFYASAGILIGIAFIVSGLVLAVIKLFYLAQKMQLNTSGKTLLTVLAVLFGISTVKSGLTPGTNRVFHASFPLIYNNVRNSMAAYHGLKSFDVHKINGTIPYEEYALENLPNLYLIFIESYGKILYQRGEFRKPYLDCIDSCAGYLAQKGWQMVSNFSVSPVSGGKSWISYSTVMFGLNFHNQGTYNSLIKNPQMSEYKNIFRILKKSGYNTYRLDALPQAENSKIPWNEFASFYAIDHWIHFNDMQYKGTLYGFGPSPPDQYSINYAGEFLQKAEKPIALFFITQTTHSPFITPDSIVQDWHSLNVTRDDNGTQKSLFLHNPRSSDYLNAVCYDLKVLTEFITSNADSNSVYILIGDHQPPVISGKQDGFETPVHIICREKSFADGFLQYGFQQGLQATEGKPVRHEGIYSMFMREFIRNFGKDTSILPAFFPGGLKPSGL